MLTNFNCQRITEGVKKQQDVFYTNIFEVSMQTGLNWYVYIIIRTCLSYEPIRVIISESIIYIYI